MTASTTFTITQILPRGGSTIVYRAMRGADRRPVVLKVLDPRRSRPADLERLKHEYEIGKLFDSPAVIKPLGLETYEGMPALILEDFGDQSLEAQVGAPMVMDTFLPLAIKIAAAVADLHQRGIVHKDLKPANILVHPTTGDVRITDFGIASRLPREQATASSPQLIEGSLPYLSPEQTGRMNRAIDNRTDLYALGVTFYEMLTGRRPFEATDPLEWVHCHVARVPPSPAAFVAALPEALSAMVLKLLAKMAEDRYQTARGLKHDLERCLSAWRAEGKIELFPLAEDDVSDHFQIPQRLYGREDEVAVLIRAFERVVTTGTPELVLVSGYSGIGKTALIHELHKPVVRERGFFISGKFDQYKRDIPYSTIVQAFQELVLEILAESEARVVAVRQRLLEALAIDAQLIVEVIPQVELIIGPQPKAPDLPPVEARNRFHRVFRHFIGVFAQAEHPVALFLDDLQWADTASLELVQELMTHPETRHLLVVGAFRDNEVTSSHPLMLTLDKVRREGARVLDVVVGPLSCEHLVALLSDTLHCGGEEAAPFAELIYEKTAGNPFFTIQFLNTLFDEGLIEFDEGTRSFRWDAAKIRAKSFTDNVVELMLGKLKRLPAMTQEALEYLACLGTSIEVAILALAHDTSEQETHSHLWEAVRAGLVLRLEGRYKFLHDRVQEAAYSLIPEQHRAEVHLRIGRRLLSRLPQGAIAERVFDIANQLDQGVGIVTDPREKEVLCRLNIQAGKKAKAAIAHASAQRYLAQATALLPADAWSARYEETFALHVERSECEYLVGNFQHADELVDLILQNARSNTDRASAHRLRMRLYQIVGRFDDAVTVALEAFRLFGVELPGSDEEIQAAAEDEHRQIQSNLRERIIDDLVDAPVATDAVVRTLIGLFAESLPFAYTARPALWRLLTVKGVNFCLRHGHAKESPLIYSFYTMVLVSIYRDFPSAFQLSQMALMLNERFEGAAATLRGKLLFHNATIINIWRRHFTTSLPLLEQAFLACLDVGDLIYAGYLTYNTVWILVESGAPLDHVIDAARIRAAFARQSHNDVVYDVVRVEEQFAASLKGATRASTSFDDDGFDEAECVAAIAKSGFGLGIAYYHVMKQIAAFIDERYAEALESAECAALKLRHVASMAIEATHHFYHALTLTALYTQAPAEQQRRFMQLLAEKLRKLKLWADNCPENFQNRHDLVSAEIARIEGRYLDAQRLYESAIHSSRANGFVQNEGLAYELASRFYRARAFDQIADMYLREARACYARWGADGKVEQIDQQHPGLVEPKSLTPTVTFAVRPAQFDLLSVTKASQTISGEIVLDKLLHTLLEVVLEQSGAQRACLLSCRGECVSIDAEAAVGATGTVTSILGASAGDLSRRVPLSLVRYVQRTKEQVILRDATTDAGKFSNDEYFSGRGPASVLCIPILRRTELVGLLYLENSLIADAFAPDRLVALSMLATQAAISLENAQLLHQEQAARAAAEGAERRATFIAEAGAVLSESLDYETTLARFGQLCVRSLADWCMIDVVEFHEIRRIAGAHVDPEKEPLLEELERRYPPRWGSPHAATTVLRTGEPLFLPELGDDELRSRCVDDAHFRLLRALGTQSVLVLPLLARGQTLGALSLVVSEPGRRFGEPDLELAGEVARRAAIAIDNARLYRAAQAAVHARDEFLAVAAHELNTPVTSLKLNLELMQRAIQSGRALNAQALDKLVRRALRQGTRLVRLNAYLLDVSRIHVNQLRLDLSEVELGAVIRDVIDQFEVELSQARCVVSLSGGAAVVGHWDRIRLEQILTNLITNAMKFGAGKPIEIQFGEEAGIARLVVRDHGIGIDRGMQERIFERFERAASVQYGGLGLGLYISRQIVEAHGGSLSVQSVPGAGATFILELPCAGPPTAEATTG